MEELAEKIVDLRSPLPFDASQPTVLAELRQQIL